MRRVLALVVSNLFLLNAQAGTHAKAMENIEFSNTIEKSTKIEGAYLNLTYQGSLGDEIIDQIVVSSIHAIKIIREETGVTQCRRSRLNVYGMSYKEINDRSVMSFLDISSTLKIDGLYDRRYSESNTASIFIAEDIDRQLIKETIAHELGHYWHDMFCLDSIMDTEKLAVRLEKI